MAGRKNEEAPWERQVKKKLRDKTSRSTLERESTRRREGKLGKKKGRKPFKDGVSGSQGSAKTRSKSAAYQRTVSKQGAAKREKVAVAVGEHEKVGILVWGSGPLGCVPGLGSTFSSFGSRNKTQTGGTIL